MPGYTPLPGYNVNALMNFAPVNNALSEVTAQNNANRNAMFQEKQFDANQQQRQFENARATKHDQNAEIEAYGKRAVAVDQMTDPAQRAAAWKMIIARHGADGLTPEELDPVTGPKLMAAQAGQFFDSLAKRERELGLQKTQAEINALNSKQDDPVQKMLLERIRGAGSPTTPAASPASTHNPVLIPQSFEGGPTLPGVQLVGDMVPAQDQAYAGPAESAGSEIDTPFGRMSREEAKSLGGTMLLSPKYAAAGKALIDSANAAESGPLGKATINQLEERTMNSAAALARLGDIKKRFDPKFLEIPTRMKMLGASWSAKLGPTIGGKLSPEMRADLGKYAAFRSAAVNNLNTILKELSGAAVTPQEYERIQNDVPTAGTGVFDGDDPVSFQSKMDRSDATLRSAIARYNFMRSRGLNFDKSNIDQFMALDDVPAAIDKRGAEIEQQLKQKNPKADPMSIQRDTRQQLKREFGI